MSEFYYLVLLPFSPKTNIDANIITNLAIERFGCCGAEEFSLDEGQVDKLLGERSYSGGDLPLDTLHEVDREAAREEGLKFYFSGDHSEELANKFIIFLEHDFLLKAYLHVLPNQDWNAHWRAHYQPIKISQGLTIVPSWESEMWNPRQSVFIYPGQGFGTGNHETTFLCLSSIMELKDVSGSPKILDFGCGSGILGIASAFVFGSNSHIDLYDIDVNAIENTSQNIDVNPHIKANFRTLLPHQRIGFFSGYDIIFANILAPVLIEESMNLVMLLNTGGSLILSGILNNQVDEVIFSYEQRPEITLINSISKGDWGCLVFKKS